MPANRTITMLFRMLICLAFISFSLHTLSFVQAQDDATCGPDKECYQGCCSKYGSCGYGPTFCGQGNCTSTCDRKPECGQYAKEPGKKCPLNVCCLEHVSTVSQPSMVHADESWVTAVKLKRKFCGKGCQNGCEKVNRPSGKGESARSKTIGYYESWSYSRECDSVAPRDIDANMWMHINFAFALIDPNTFKIARMNSYDDMLYPQVIDLKLQSAGLQVYIAAGGWAAGGKIFTDMVASASNRKAFIDSSVQFCKTHGFDGIDIDWEYPSTGDRGGVTADYENVVTFMKELRAAAGNLGVDLTLPNSYWYLQGLNVKALEEYVDWFNVMSYDIHGTWDGANKNTKKEVNPHTNITEISLGLDLLWRNGVSNSKVVLGLGFYGRSFALKDPSCNNPGCPFSSGAEKGECTGESGILSNSEIQRIMSANNVKPVFDKEAGVKWITWGSDQWVSYDDAETLQLKIKFANGLGLAGTMVWALDLDNKDGEAAQYLSADTSSTGLGVIQRKRLSADKKQAYVGQMAYWTPCMSDDERTKTGCPGGYHEILVGHGKTFDTDSFEQSMGCHGSQNRLLCLNNEILETNCHWNRQTDGSKICDKSCPDNTIFLTQNTHPAGDKTDCAHGSFIAVCCNNLQVLTSVCKNQYSADYIFSGGLSGAGGMDFHFTRGSLKERSLSTRGTHLKARAEEVNSGIAKEQQDQTLAKTDDERKKKKKRAQDGYNNSNPCDSRFEYDFPQPPKNLGYIAVYADGIILGTGSAQATWGALHTRVTVTSTHMPDSVTRVAAYAQKTCAGERYPQLCANWRSIALNYNLRTIPCPDAIVRYNAIRFAPREWYDTHHSVWSSYIEKSVYAPYAGKDKPSNCQSDEWPPFDIWGNRHLGYAGIYVRYLPGGENGGASSWRDPRFRLDEDCGGLPPWTSSTEDLGTEAGVYTDTIWEQMHFTRTLTSVVMNWRNMPVIAGDPDLLTANVCWLKALGRNFEPGFALNWYDRQYGGQGALWVQQCKFVPAPAITQGIPKPTRKRSVEVLVHPDDTVAYVVDAGNSTRPATSEEIAEGLGLDACLDIHCTQEKERMRNDVVGHRKRQVYLNEHNDEVNSILAAGMPLQELKNFETVSSEMVLTDSPVAPPVPTETHSGATVHSPVVTVTVTETAAPIVEGRAQGHMKAHMRKREHAKHRGVQ